VPQVVAASLTRGARSRALAPSTPSAPAQRARTAVADRLRRQYLDEKWRYCTTQPSEVAWHWTLLERLVDEPRH